MTEKPWHKADLHLHTAKDPKDKISYSPFELIDKLAAEGFLFAAITHHEQVYEDKKVFSYAKKKGIILIRGAETKIEGKEVLIYNISEDERKKIRTFVDLRDLRKKRKDILTIAPHPYYPMKDCLHKKLAEHIDCFDAIEYCYMHPWYFDHFNAKAKKIASKFGKALVASSDAHLLWQVGHNNYTLTQATTINEFFSDIKKNKVKVQSVPMTTGKIIKILRYHKIMP